MWSLPDIVRLNDAAAEAAKTKTYEQQAANPQEHQCLVCEWQGQETPADYGYVIHNVFGPHPDEAVFVCEDHDGTTGSPLEGYFSCAQCEKYFAENITWEKYNTIVNGEEFCLPCALQSYIAHAPNWIPLNEVESVVIDAEAARDAYDDEDSPVFDPSTGAVNLALARHLIGVKMPVPDSILFERNVEMDSSTGQMLASSMSTYGPGASENAMLRELQELHAQGYTKVLVILDAAYQFSVSLGIYLDAAEHGRIQAGQDAEVQEAMQDAA